MHVRSSISVASVQGLWCRAKRPKTGAGASSAPKVIALSSDSDDEPHPALKRGKAAKGESACVPDACTETFAAGQYGRFASMPIALLHAESDHCLLVSHDWQVFWRWNPCSRTSGRDEYLGRQVSALLGQCGAVCIDRPCGDSRCRPADDFEWSMDGSSSKAERDCSQPAHTSLPGGEKASQNHSSM